jgi:Fe-S-cluster containining protein
VRYALPVPTDCHGCGVCCTGQEALPVGYWLGPLGDADPRKLPAEIRANLEALAFLFSQHGWPNGTPCVWYDDRTRQCRHHPWRPDICQEFEVGGPECRHVRELHRPELLERIAQAKRDAARPRRSSPRRPQPNRRDGR